MKKLTRTTVHYASAAVSSEGGE